MNQHNKSKIKQWSKKVFAILLILIVVIFFWVEYQMRFFRGEFSKEVDVSKLETLGGAFIVRDLNVLNSDGYSMNANQDVIIVDGMIESLGEDLDYSEDMQVVDGKGMYMIPGLMDGHVHLSSNHNNLLLNLLNGVTHVRDMGGALDQLEMRDQARQGQLSPELFVVSSKVYSQNGLGVWFTKWTRSRIILSSSKEAKGLVDSLVDEGFDGLKISNGIKADSYAALMSAAKEVGLPVMGHIPDEVPLNEFLEMGQGEIAHVEELTKALSREFGGMNHSNAKEFLAYVNKRSIEVAKRLKANDTVVTSVIWLMESLPRQKFDLDNLLKAVELQYMDPAKIEGTPLIRGWLPGYNSYAARDEVMQNPERLAQVKIFWDTYVKAIHIMIKVLNDHKVKIIAGTDAITTGAVPGFALHDELISLVNAGMTPAESLRSATLVPGQWLEKLSHHKTKLGKILPGYRANLVLLRENPLKDIRHIRTIESVIISGQLIKRQQLDVILDKIKKANDESRTQDISQFIDGTHD